MASHHFLCTHSFAGLALLDLDELFAGLDGCTLYTGFVYIMSGKTLYPGNLTKEIHGLFYYLETVKCSHESHDSLFSSPFQAAAVQPGLP